LLLVSAVVLNFLITRVLRLDKIALKQLDYWWLTISAFAIFGLVEKNRLELNTVEITKMNWQVGADSILLDLALDSNAICRNYSRSEYSPDNLEHIQLLTDSLCSVLKTIIVPAQEKMKNKQPIEILLPIFPDELLQNNAQDINTAISNYNHSLKRLKQLEKNSSISDVNFTLQLFSPLLLILGLAIRFSKTAAEIRLERKK
jgi:hypothetical protein